MAHGFGVLVRQVTDVQNMKSKMTERWRAWEHGRWAVALLFSSIHFIPNRDEKLDSGAVFAGACETGVSLAGCQSYLFLTRREGKVLF